MVKRIATSACIFLLIAALLAACSVPVAPSVVPSDFSGQAESPPVVPITPIPPVPSSPPPVASVAPIASQFGDMILADMTGSGQLETVELIGMYRPGISAGDNVCPELYAVVGGVEYRLEIEPIAWLWFVSCTVFDADGDGTEELLFYFSPGGQGGHGSGIITLVKWQPDGFVYLPVPQTGHETQDQLHGGYGFAAEISLLDDHMAELACDETGFVQSFPIGSLGASEDDVYGEDGKINSDYMDNNGVDLLNGVDSLSEVRVLLIDGKPEIQIGQYGWVISHVGGVCVFVTTFSYENGNYAVSEQTVIPIDEWNRLNEANR